MPLVRYEIRNEYSLANPELYKSASKDDPEALLEGVAMAGLVGIVRQLGDLAEFAAEVFHDIHEEVMATAARGHGLMIRVQQLEAEFPLVEKALMSGTNQIHFAYTAGSDWHASIRNDQNHLTQGDLPRFILNSYEECRGPPRLFLLDKFDVAGAGACLKRYTDPSFFKMEWASSELMKAEKAQREKKARRVKKKGRRRRNGETPDIAPMSRLNSRVRYSSLDLDRPKHVTENLVNNFNEKLKSKQVDESPLLEQEIGRKYMQESFNKSSAKENEHVLENSSNNFNEKLKPRHLYESPCQDQVFGRNYMQGPSNSSLLKEDAHESSSQEWEEKPAVEVVHGTQLRDNLATVPILESCSTRISTDTKAERLLQDFVHVEQKEVLIDGVSKPEVHADGDQSDDAASEIDNYMDALTTMESEMETDSECRTKNEVDSDINSEHRETSGESHEQPAQRSDFVGAEVSTGFYNCESSDESSKVDTFSRFLEAKTSEGFANANAESTLYTMNATIQDNLANVEPPTSLTTVPLSVGTSNDLSISGLEDGILPTSIVNSLSSESLNNIQIMANEETQSSTDILPAIEADSVYHQTFGNGETTEVPNQESSSVFEKIDTNGVCVNSAPCDGLDNGESSFRFATPELYLLGNDVESPMLLNEESLTIANLHVGSSEDIVAELKICSPKVDKVNDTAAPLSLSDINIKESVDICDAELVSGIENAVIQDEHECIQLQAHDAENITTPKSINSESSYSRCADLQAGLSSPELVGRKSLESGVQIVHNGFSMECVHSDSAHIESFGPGKDAEFSAVLPIDGFTPKKSMTGSQEDEEATESTCPESMLDVTPMDLQPQLNVLDAQIPENYSSNSLSGFSGNKLTDSLESSKVPVNVLEKDLSNDNPIMETGIDSGLAVPPDDAPLELSSHAGSSTDENKDRLPNEFAESESESESDAFLGAKAPTITAFSPAASLHSSSPKLSSDGSHENTVNIESHNDLHSGVPTEVFDPESPTDPSSEKLHIASLHTGSGIQHLNDILSTKSVDADPFAEAESPPKPSNNEVPDPEPPSPPLEHIKISFAPAADSPLSGYSTSSDHVSESPTPERHPLYESKTYDLSSSFHLLPEPAIPLQHGAENLSIGDLGSLSSHSRRKSPEMVSDKVQFLQQVNTDYDSDSEELKEFGNSSPNFPGELYNQLSEPTAELAVYSGMTANNDGESGSPRASFTSSMSSSSSPDTSRDSLLLNLKRRSAEAGAKSFHSSNISIGSSPRSPIFSALQSPMSPEGSHHNIQGFSESYSTAFDTGLLVPTSPTLEPKLPGTDLQELPPPPPLPPLEWRIMKPRQCSSLLLMEGAEPPAPPALPAPLMPTGLAQDPAAAHSVSVVQKEPIERKDSLIEAIASHDKSTLRKVTKPMRSVSAKPSDDREVLLEQIRTRSFNLRRTVVVKHNIPRPATNINVAAILEKANAIRQAFAGSEEDEDDDDDWSDA
eukprot:Gb_27613 [translate_table: standard]